MKIDGTDIGTKYGSKIEIGQQTVQPRSVASFLNWPDDYDRPIGRSINPKGKYFEIEIEIVVHGTSKQDAELTISNLLNDLKMGELELDQMNFLFSGELQEIEKTFVNAWDYVLNLTFRAWSKTGPLEIVQVGTSTSKVIDNPGNVLTPCIIEVTPSNDVIKFTITGAAHNSATLESETIVLNNLNIGETTVIDGINGIILEDGSNKFSEAELWEFPTLLPGSNMITFTSSGASCDVVVKYYPRYF